MAYYAQNCIQLPKQNIYDLGIKKTKFDQRNNRSSNKTISDPRQVAQQFNKFFISLGEQNPEPYRQLPLTQKIKHLKFTRRSSLVQTNKQN